MTDETLPEWEYLPGGWTPSDAAARGWDHPSVGEAMLRCWPEFREIVAGSQPLGIYPLAPSAGSESGHNLSMSFGYVLARSAQGRSAVSVLDWGGAIGHYAAMASALMPELQLDYTVRDLPDLCRIGQAVLPSVRFLDTDAAVFSRRYDLVMAMGSIQYVEDWAGVVEALVRAAERYVFITRVPVVQRVDSFVVLHRPRGIGYRTEYLSWILNRDALIGAAARCGARLEREFIAGGRTAYPGAPADCETAGFLFRVG